MMRGRRSPFGHAVLALVLAAAFCSIAFARGDVPSLLVHPVPTPLASPSPGELLGPPARRLPGPLPGVFPQFGAPVPLSLLPPLPPRTARNTIYASQLQPYSPSARERLRPLSATGASIYVYGNNNPCNGSVGQIFVTGCQVSWFAYLLDGPNDTFQDYDIAPNATVASPVGAPYVNNGGCCPTHATTLNSAGTWVFASYDTTASYWDTVIYIVAGSSAFFDTYADSTLRNESTNFSNAAGTSVYINAASVAPTDNYVVYVESTSGHISCSFIFPTPSGGIPPNSLCNAASSSGQSSPSGSLTVDWQLASTLPPGTYSIVLYDLTTSTRVAQRQVTLHASGSSPASVSFVGAGGNPTPNPAPYASPVPLANGIGGSPPGLWRFAFDGATDTSTASINAVGSGLSAGATFYQTISDPDGAVIVANQSNSTSFATTLSGLQAPNNYIGNTYSAAFYNVATSQTEAASSFKILGYNAVTQFTGSSGTGPLSTSIVLPKNSSSVSGLRFTNDGDTIFGTGNGDSLIGLYFSTNANSITINLGSGSSSCGTNCQTEQVLDSAGNTWNVYNVCSGGGTSAGCTITALPATAGVSLGMNAYLSIPPMTFVNGPGNSSCVNGCTGITSIFPAHGFSWSAANSAYATNTVGFTNGAGTTYAGTAAVTLIGARAQGRPQPGPAGVVKNEDLHGYIMNSTSIGNSIHATLAQNSPYAVASSNGPWDVFNFNVANNSSGGSNVTELEITMPSPFSPGNYINVIQIDPGSPTAWQYVNCPSGAPQSAFCIATNKNPGIPPGGNENIWIDIAPVAPNSFAYTDWSIQAVDPNTNNVIFPFASTPNGTAYVPNTLAVDSLSMAAYTVDGSTMTGLFSPTSVGTNTAPTVTISVQNSSTASAPYPDYLDTIIVSLPSSVSVSNIVSQTSGWSLVGSNTSPLNGSYTDYWFAVCSNKYVTADGPPANPVPAPNPPQAWSSLPQCSTASNEQNALAPGSTFSFTATLGNLTSAGTITAELYGHGANTNGWSQAHSFALTVSSTSALAGFSAIGPYGAPTAVASGTEPQIGADSNPTYGNSYVYTIKNNSSTNAITTATITIPGKDNSGAIGTDSGGTAWTITQGPTITTGPSGCSVTSWQNPTTTGTNGFITIGGSSCSLAPNASIVVSFAAKAPYMINSTFAFPTVVNTNIPASETWFGDTDVLIVLNASISITVNPPNPGPGGSMPVVTCSTCAFTAGNVNFGNFLNNTTNSFGDVVDVSVYTDAATPVGWKLYVSTNTNPARSPSTPTNELLTAVDSARSTTGAGLNFDTTSYTVLPVSSPGQLMVDTGSGAIARRLPYDVLQNYQLSIGSETLAPNTSTVTYTFISN